MHRFLSALLFFVVSFAALATPYSNVIVFGDSLSDIGNNTWVATPGRGFAFEKGAPITNIDPIKLKPMLWIQYLVKKGLFTQKTVMPSSQWEGQDLSVTNVDYAWASAETGDRYLNDLATPFIYAKNCAKAGYVNQKESCVPGVMLQVQDYLTALKSTHQTPGKNTLFIIWAGGNDIFDNVERGMDRFNRAKTDWKAMTPQQAESFAWFPSYNLYRAINLLIKAGVPANHIYIFNLPDISKTPAANQMILQAFSDNSKEQEIIFSAIQAISNWFNFDIQMWVNYGSHAKTKPTIISIHDIFNTIATTHQFEHYQFFNVTDSCVAEKKSPSCPGYLFFNDKHPTVITGQLLADYLANYLKKQPAE
jgi:phospholipase/lecithinase/hemolysin